MTIKALFVDLGGVLIINNGKAISDKFETEHGLKKQDIQEIFRFIQTSNRTEQELDVYIAGKGINRKLWDSFTATFFHSERRNDALYRILKEARSRGILIVYTTNNSAALEAIIDKFAIRDVVDIVINSSAAGVAKPDTNFWQLSLDETRKLLPDISPDEILVLDDSEANCISAKKIGLTVVIYKVGIADAEIIEYIH